MTWINGRSSWGTVILLGSQFICCANPPGAETMSCRDIHSLFHQLVSVSDPQEAMAVRARIESCGPDAAAHCREVLATSSASSRELEEAMFILSTFREPGDSSLVAHCLTHPTATVRATAAIELAAAWPGPRHTGEITIALRQETVLVDRILLVKALGTTGDPSGPALLDEVESQALPEELARMTPYGSLGAALRQARMSLADAH